MRLRLTNMPTRPYNKNVLKRVFEEQNFPSFSRSSIETEDQKINENIKEVIKIIDYALKSHKRSDIANGKDILDKTIVIAIRSFERQGKTRELITEAYPKAVNALYEMIIAEDNDTFSKKTREFIEHCHTIITDYEPPSNIILTCYKKIEEMAQHLDVLSNPFGYTESEISQKVEFIRRYVDAMHEMYKILLDLRNFCSQCSPLAAVLTREDRTEWLQSLPGVTTDTCTKLQKLINTNELFNELFNEHERNHMISKIEELMQKTTDA